MSDVFKLVKLLDSLSFVINTSGVLDNVSAIVAPGVSDDSSSGYSISSKWIDVVNDEAYIAVDVSVGAAVWLHISSAEELAAHIADVGIHFTEASIDHDNIQNNGNLTHAQIEDELDFIEANYMFNF